MMNWSKFSPRKVCTQFRTILIIFEIKSAQSKAREQISKSTNMEEASNIPDSDSINLFNIMTAEEKPLLPDKPPRTPMVKHKH